MANPRFFDTAALDMTYSKHLTAIDGIQPDIAENVREVIDPLSTNDDEDQEMEFEAKKNTAIIQVEN